MTGDLYDDKRITGAFPWFIEQKHNITLKYSLWASIFQSLQYKEVNTKTSTLRRHAIDLNAHNDTICIRKLSISYSCIVAYC